MYQNSEAQYWTSVVERNRKVAALRAKLRGLQQEALDKAGSVNDPNDGEVEREATTDFYYYSPEIEKLKAEIMTILTTVYIVSNPDGTMSQLDVPNPPMPPDP
tara:strand:+ start:512 stop:820 length:309 start_codon:yes stop_codon:yes gene_type:complete